MEVVFLPVLAVKIIIPIAPGGGPTRIKTLPQFLWLTVMLANCRYDLEKNEEDTYKHDFKKSNAFRPLISCLPSNRSVSNLSGHPNSSYTFFTLDMANLVALMGNMLSFVPLSTNKCLGAINPAMSYISAYFNIPGT